MQGNNIKAQIIIICIWKDFPFQYQEYDQTGSAGDKAGTKEFIRLVRNVDF